MTIKGSFMNKTPNAIDSIKKISSERLQEIKLQVNEIAFKGIDQSELDSKLDSNEVKVTNVSNDINGIMDLITSAINQTIRNLRRVSLPLNIKDFSIDNIKNHLNLDKSIEKLTQGLDFASLGINDIRVSYSTFVQTDSEGNLSVGRMVKNIVKQLRDDDNFIMLEIPTKVIKKDMMDSITSIVVALYIAFIEVKHNVEIVGSGKNAKFNNSIQEYLLNIGLVLTELDRYSWFKLCNASAATAIRVVLWKRGRAKEAKIPMMIITISIKKDYKKK